jgi:hypothetical protein
MRALACVPAMSCPRQRSAAAHEQRIQRRDAKAGYAATGDGRGAMPADSRAGQPLVNAHAAVTASANAGARKNRS